MKAIFFFGILVGMIGSVVAADPYIMLGGQKFYLAYAPKDSDVGLREYLPKGEKLDHWTRMASVRTFKDLSDPKEFLTRVGENVTKSDPAARYQFIENEEKGSLILDFLVFSSESPKKFAEWNLMCAKYEKGKGLTVYQYARRFYTIDDKAADELNAERKRMVKPFDEATFREVAP